MRFTYLTSPVEIAKVIADVNKHCTEITLDTETTDKDPKKALLLDVQISGVEDDQVFMFGAEYAYLLELIRVPIVAHSYKYDAHVLYRHGVNLLDYTWRDTVLIGHLVDENRARYSLDSYVQELFYDNYKEVFWAKHKTYEEASDEDKLEYACKDIYYTRRLYALHRSNIDRQGIPEALVEQVHRLQTSLLRTEINGVRVDTEYLAKKGVDVKVEMDALQPVMLEHVKDEASMIELDMWSKALVKYKTDRGRKGCERPKFSFQSANQIKTLLYEHLGVPEQYNEKTKNLSVDYDSLQKIKDHHPIIELIQRDRDLQKIYSAYIEGTLERMVDGRIYPEFRVNGTATGRISSANPNMQQLPASGGIRGIYVPSDDNVIISADYSSLEIYISANFTKDPNLVRIVRDGVSMHDVTSESLGIPRDVGKILNFAEQYGCGPGKVMKIVQCSMQEAIVIHEKYWATYAGQQKLMKECAIKVDQGIPITTPWGRRRRFEHKSRNKFDKAYRQAWNFLVQSTGADCTQKAYYLFNEHLVKTGRGRAWFPIHDEVIAEVKKEYASEELINLCRIMSAVGDEIGLEFPLKASPSGPSDRWED